jgi:hypothetical protein
MTIGLTCSTQGEKTNAYKVSLRKLDHLDDLCALGTIILKCIAEKQWEGIEWIYVA